VTAPRSLAEALAQDELWVDGQRLGEMDRHHRANLIPFLRRSAEALRLAAGAPGPAEDWLERTPLMRRLTELERGRPIEERKETARRNAEYEAETGYEKIVLLPGRESAGADREEGRPWSRP
jgi:hypothetical protein